jgi:TonB family protein
MALPQGLLVGIDVLGAVLLHFLWQGAVVGLLHAALKPWCASAAARYRLGLSALAALALAPLLTAYACWTADASALGSSPTVFAGPLHAGAQALADWQLKSLLPWLVAVWLCGVIAIAARSLWQWRRLMRVVRSADAAPVEWQSRLRRLCGLFQLRQPVRLLCSAAATTPMLLGWIKPVILLPASMLSGFTPLQIEMIIAHELGHIRRFDYLVNLLQVALETVLFYHPVVHWISRDVRNAREACCDDLALQFAGGSRLVYARALAELEELRLSAPTLALGAGGGALLARIKRIVGESENAEPLPRNYMLPVVVVLALAMFSWRLQHATTDAGTVVSRISAQALALLSGTALRIERPTLSIVLPQPDIRPTIKRNSIELAPAPVPAAATAADALAAPAVSSIAEAPAPAMPTSAPAVAAPAPLHSEETLAVAAPLKSAPLHVVAPAYPAQAMIAGIEGAVELEYRIGANGSVGQIRVVSAHPAGIFDEAAKTALRGWQFPAASGGEMRTQNFAFTLHGQNKAEEQCQAPTGSLICRKPGG